MDFDRGFLKKNIEEQRWSITALANKLDVGRSTIHLWLKGHHEPPNDKLIEISKLLSVPISKLVKLESEPDYQNKKQVTLNNLFTVTDTFDKNTPKSKIDSILQSISKLNSLSDKRTFILNAVMEFNPVPMYIKDDKQRFITANKAFREILKLPDDFIIQGKQDANFLPVDEASSNTKEDLEVLITGVPVNQKEKHFLGTRKRKWCLMSKIPLYTQTPSKETPVGIMAVFIDITEKKQQQLMKESILNALKKMRVCLWVGKGIQEDENGVFRIKDVQCQYLDENIANCYSKMGLDSITQIRNYHNNVIIDSDERRNLDIRKVMEQRLFYISYDAKNPLDNNKKIRLMETIQYFPEDDSFAGILIEDPTQKALLEQKLKMLDCLKNNNIPSDIIDKISALT